MYKVLLSTFFVLSFLVFSTQAQTYRLRSLADNLQRNTDDLAEKTYSDFTRSFSNSRSDVDNLLISQQLKASADLQDTVERVHGVYADKCPVYRSLRPAFQITSSWEFA